MWLSPVWFVPPVTLRCGGLSEGIGTNSSWRQDSRRCLIGWYLVDTTQHKREYLKNTEVMKGQIKRLDGWVKGCLRTVFLSQQITVFCFIPILDNASLAFYLNQYFLLCSHLAFIQFVEMREILGKELDNSFIVYLYYFLFTRLPSFELSGWLGYFK